MVHVLGDRHLRQQAGIGLAAVDDRRGHHLLAGPAGVLRVHLALDVELKRLARQLLAHVLADGHQRALALWAGARSRLVPGLHALQVLGQRLATGDCPAPALLRGRGVFALGLDRFHCGDVGGHRLVEQRPLRRVHAL